MKSVSLFEAARLLLSNDNYVILIHERPDGDAVGSGEALRILLKALGKKAELVCPDALPAELSLLIGRQVGRELPEEKATFISVDVAQDSLLGSFKEPLNGRILLKLDHHRTGEDFAEFNYTDACASAAGELVYDLAEMLEIKDKKMYEMIYAAIASDTGCFRYTNTTAKTHRIASALFDGGIDAPALNNLLFESKDLKTVRATALGIEKTEFLFDGQAAICCFTNEMRASFGYEDEHLSEIASALREIRGVELAAVLKQSESDPHSFRLSTRSKSFFDCAALCRRFSGGGHLRASGGSVEADSPEEAAGLLKSAMIELWKKK